MTIPTVSRLTNLSIFQFLIMARARKRQRTRFTAFKRSRTTKRQSWNESDMMLALKAVRGEILGEVRLGYKSAAKQYNVPKSTLERRHKGKNKIAVGSTKFLGTTKSILPADLENELTSHILLMEEKGFGLTYVDVRKLAYELAEANGVVHKFNKADGMAGKYWLYGFLGRHPELSLRTPENTSMARAVSFNKGNVDKFFDLLDKTLKENPSIGPDMIFNCDETGLTTVPNHPPKIVGRTNKKQVGTVSSAERGVNTTALLTVNALGNTVPPWFVFPRVRHNPQLMIGAPEGSVQDNHISGWMQTDIFYRWVEWFIKHIRCSKDKKALLILDGHATHVKSIKTIKLARENGLIVIALPPHCTHRLQVLDVSCMKPLSSNFSIEVQQWLRQNAGAVVTIYEVATLFKNAYQKSLTPENITNGFKKTGIWPFDRTVFDNVFTENTSTPVDESVPCLTETSQPCGSGSDIVSSNAQDEESQDVAEGISRDIVSPNLISGTSCVTTSTPNPVESQDVDNLNETGAQNLSSTQQDDQNCSSRVLPKDLMPVPTIAYNKKSSKNKRAKNRMGKTAIITGSPYLKDLTLIEENKELSQENKELKRIIKELKKTTNLPASSKSTSKGSARKTLFNDIKKKQRGAPGRDQRKQRNRVLNLSSSESEKDYAEEDLLQPEDSDLITCTDQSAPATGPVQPACLDLEEGQYVLVEFTGRSVGVGSFYIGCIVTLKEDEMVHTKFLRRCDLKKNRTMKFRELTEEDEEEMFGVHSKEQVKLILPPPTNHRGTARTRGSLVFQDERLDKFATYIE